MAFLRGLEYIRKIGVKIKIPHLTSKQKIRVHFENHSVEKYYRISQLIPYLNSFTSYLSQRLYYENQTEFSISLLYLLNLKKYSISEFNQKINLIHKQ